MNKRRGRKEEREGERGEGRGSERGEGEVGMYRGLLSDFQLRYELHDALHSVQLIQQVRGDGSDGILSIGIE